MKNGKYRVLIVASHPVQYMAPVYRLMAQHPKLDVTVAFSVHRNPSVRDTVSKLLSAHPRIVLLDPLPYPQFVHLMKRANLILTDSGGIQEEAPSIGTPVLVLREVTERPEAVESGWAEVVGTSIEAILTRADYWLNGPKDTSSGLTNPFGDGRASQRIVQILQGFDGGAHEK